MQRRHFFAGALCAPFATTASQATVAVQGPLPDIGWRRYEVTTRVALPDMAGAASVWLPLAQTAAGYQVVTETRHGGTGRQAILHDSVYGSAVLHAAWPDQGAPRQVEVTQIVATQDRAGLPFVPLSTAERTFWSAATPDIPTDGIVRATAERIIGSLSEPRAQLRALYDWVVDTTWRDPDTPGCGLGDIKSMLETSRYGGKCADINGLMTGLARAAGFPARDVYGIRVGTSELSPSLGRTGDVSRAQHCRSEVFLPDTGWFPVDPADVRKVVLEQKLAIDSPAIQALRERLFGHWEMNWVGYNSATGMELPGASKAQRPSFAFLMYPCGFVGNKQLDPLDPAQFRYEITSRSLSS